MTDPHISSTAFICCESKARCPGVSRDCYAHLWTSPETASLWEDFAAKACPRDDLELSLRNRYFLDHIEEFVTSVNRGGAAVPIVLNIGAGFTSYPYLLNRPCRVIEVDYPHIIAHKQRRVADFQSQALLPEAAVDYFAANLSADGELERFAEACEHWLSGTASFALLEGITYYLPRPKLEKLLTIIAQHQQPGSKLALEYWQQDITGYPSFQRLEWYFSEHLGFPANTYTFLDESFVRAVRGYELIDLGTLADQEPKYCGTRYLSDPDAVLPAYVCVLSRRAEDGAG